MRAIWFQIATVLTERQTRARTTANPPESTSPRCRRDQRAARSTSDGGRTRIGWPLENRLRSSASSTAVGIPVHRLLGHRLQDDRLEVAGNPAIEPARRDGILVADLVNERGQVICRERPGDRVKSS